jgi:hypothetical protein
MVEEKGPEEKGPEEKGDTLETRDTLILAINSNKDTLARKMRYKSTGIIKI